MTARRNGQRRGEWWHGEREKVGANGDTAERAEAGRMVVRGQCVPGIR